MPTVADRYPGRVIRQGATDWTVTSAESEGRHGPVTRITVFCPTTNEYLIFDSVETFEHWAYGTPVPAAGRSPMANVATCRLCGEPMPIGEEMFKFHGYSGPCPKPPLPKPEPDNLPDDTLREMWRRVQGPNAELTGPLIRFAGLVYTAGRRANG